jgi:hypothetical protein
MNETPQADRAARGIAENVYAAYCRLATMPNPYREEQTVVTRLGEAIRLHIAQGSPGELIDVVNLALSQWEERDPSVRGPRVVSINPIDGTVSVAQGRDSSRHGG